MTNIATITMIIWILLVLFAAYKDWRSFRIPNILPASLILLFILFHAATGFSGDLWSNLYHFLIALSGGMLLFWLGWMGGGDAKLYAGIALWLGLGAGALFVFTTGIMGLMLALVYLATRKFRLRKLSREERIQQKKDSRIPYGVAIAIGALVTFHNLGWDTAFPGTLLSASHEQEPFSAQFESLKP